MFDAELKLIFYFTVLLYGTRADDVLDYKNPLSKMAIK